MLYVVGATIGRPRGHNVTFTPHEIQGRMRLPCEDHTRRPCHSELVELFRRRSRCLASPFRVRLRAMPYAQDDTAKKREANADAESRAASLKMTRGACGIMFLHRRAVACCRRKKTDSRGRLSLQLRNVKNKIRRTPEAQTLTISLPPLL